MLVWIKFIACVIIILYAGSSIARYADIIAVKTGLGRMRVGILILAVVTSMPELVTSVSSVTIIGDPNLGLGTLIGACIFNLFILVIFDFARRGKPLLSQASTRNIRLAATGSVLAGLLGAGVFVTRRFPVSLGPVGVFTTLVFIIYMVMIWRFAKVTPARKTPTKPVLHGNAIERNLWVKFAFSIVAIIGGGIWLSYVGNEITLVTGWGSSFVGSLLLAITTSLPEVTVVFTAVRIGAIDLAVADLLGVNMLDLTYIFFNDLFYRDGPILAVVTQAHLINLGLLMLMNLVIILALKFQSERKTFFVASWYSPVLVLLYIFGAYLMFITTSG